MTSLSAQGGGISNNPFSASSPAKKHFFCVFFFRGVARMGFDIIYTICISNVEFIYTCLCIHLCIVCLIYTIYGHQLFFSTHLSLGVASHGPSTAGHWARAGGHPTQPVQDRALGSATGCNGAQCSTRWLMMRGDEPTIIIPIYWVFNTNRYDNRSKKNTHTHMISNV